MRKIRNISSDKPCRATILIYSQQIPLGFENIMMKMLNLSKFTLNALIYLLKYVHRVIYSYKRTVNSRINELEQKNMPNDLK